MHPIGDARAAGDAPERVVAELTLDCTGLKPWSPQQLMSTREAVAAGGGATGGVEGAQPPGKNCAF